MACPQPSLILAGCRQLCSEPQCCRGRRSGTARARRTERSHRENGERAAGQGWALPRGPLTPGRAGGAAPRRHLSTARPGQQRAERCPAGALLPGRGGAGPAPPVLGARRRLGTGPRRAPHRLGPFPPQSAGRPCPEPDFAGGSGCACPWSAPAGVSKETWAAVCAAEPPHSQVQREARPPGQFCSPQLGVQDAVWQGDQLSSQLYRNKQLQDTLLQKEEELARLHEENNNLRQYLNSALIKCLEEKAKKLLSDHGQKTCAILKSTKRRLKEDYCFVRQETPHASKARRNLFNEFTACEEQASPAVDSWVLQTLGLKDVNTIDETSANYSALSPDLRKDTYCLSPGGTIDYEHREGAAAVFSCSHVPPANSITHPCSEDSPFLPQFSSASCVSSPVPSVSSLPAYGLPYLTGGLSPNKTEVAFTTSLSPHRNVRTHSFHQGQAFVRRDDDGGWRFTWVPKQAE
ncbi:geminin coiled-coil domain-containing protein 1 [Poecile atricapillus]|uniref:geminin coiled-coil domain-containing protein 1 n=1 Tax=Poecile atricapillus TaxID=48891 RepID=UPI002739F3AF|nr:geminin coiled-coil domain-containing protein 1 [Poecile atricapillus]